MITKDADQRPHPGQQDRLRLPPDRARRRRRVQRRRVLGPADAPSVQLVRRPNAGRGEPSRHRRAEHGLRQARDRRAR